MENIEKIIEQLKQSNKMAHKYIAKRLLRLYQKTINDEKLYEKDEINRRCYNLLLEIVDDNTRRELLTADGIVKILSNRIERSSYWTKDNNNNFYLEDVGNHYHYEVIHNETGFESKNDDYYEIEFIDKNIENLNVIHLTLLEREIVLNNYKLKDEKDRELAEELITFLNHKKSKEKTKVM